MNFGELRLTTERPKIPNQKGTGQACKALTFSLNAFLWTIFFFFKTASNQFQNFSDVNEQIGELKGETGAHGTPGIFWLAEAEFQPLLALYRSENRLMAELSIFQQNNTPHLSSAHVPIEFKMLAP